MARVAATKREPKPVDDVNATAREYVMIKAEIAKLEKQQKALRDSLMQTVEMAGYEDDLGHKWIDLDEDIAGIAGLQRQRRVSRGVDMESATDILKALELWDECTEIQYVLNEDAIYKALFDEKLTDADIDTIYPQHETYALVTKK